MMNTTEDGLCVRGAATEPPLTGRLDEILAPDPEPADDDGPGMQVATS